MGLQGMGYKMDIVFVIDATASMTPIMTQVKQNALVLGDKICEEMKKAKKEVEFLRMKVIDFGDFATEGDEAIRSTDFYAMPADRTKFNDAVNQIDITDRGGDIPENGFEALFVAMNSDWVHIGPKDKGRHLIVLMTDAVPLHLGERDGCIGYNVDDYPSSVDELAEIWDANQQSAFTKLSKPNRRLLLYVPAGTDEEGHTWNPITSWEWTTTINVTDAEGLKDVDISSLVTDIVRSA